MMKTKLLLALSLLVGTLAQGQSRQYQSLQTNWRFAKGNPEGAALPTHDDAGWESVTIPHDWAISGPFDLDGNGSTGKLPWKGQAWYRRSLEIPAAAQGKRFYLIFDGVMAFPKVYVNGQLAGTWDYGYNSFYLDITDLAKAGEPNTLAVHVDTRQHDSRWYPGAGIYRKVQLLTVDPIHVAVWGNYITTPLVKPHTAAVRLRTEVQNASASPTEVLVTQTLVSPEGVALRTDSARQTVPAQDARTLEVNTTLLNPQRWDVAHPQLYTAVTRVYANGQLRDETETTFGVRSIRFTADDGFYLNDRRVQLKGVNLHHDHGPLGGAFYPRAMERQLQIMKDMGVNAIRNSHNTAAPEFLELCDRMGLLVFNEVFDKYDAKAGILDTTNFEAFAERNIRNFVMRDRNHPSIFLWSVGNEIGDVQWNINSGHHRLHTMLNYVNKYDPTRPTTLVNDNQQSATLRHFDLYDVHAWNYGRRYALARQMEPNKSVVISESASTLSTRGFYELPLPAEKTDFTHSLQVSSYDLNAPDWAEVSDDDFMWQQEEPYVAGEFVWTGFDYLGEPTPYDNRVVKEMGMTDREASRSSYFGIVDLVGLPKDRFYLYKSYWNPEETTIHILPHWNWSGMEGDTVPVFVYTNGDCAELFLNGQSLGRQCKQPQSQNSTERFRLMWKDVVYQPGELRVVAYRQGEKLGEATRKTTGEPYRLRLTVDRATIQADGLDLAYITVEALDKEGNPHPLADQAVQIDLSGVGEIAGVGNGNPQSFAPFQASTVNLFYGKAMIIVKGGFDPGTAKITVTADGLKKTSTEVKVVR